MLLTYALSTSLITLAQAELSPLAEMHESLRIQKYGVSKSREVNKKIEDAISVLSRKVELNKTNKGTQITVTWQFSKAVSTNALGRMFPTYFGEVQPEKKEAKLYMFESPLGQTNGITQELRTSEINTWLTDNYLSHLNVFLRASHKEQSILIPLITTASINGCGSSLFESPKEYLCIQTSNPSKGELSTHHKDGFTNTFFVNETIDNPLDITTSVEIYYKGVKL